jgi:mono/diheme cytochrome c family protein
MEASGRFRRLVSMIVGGCAILAAIGIGVMTAPRPAHALGLFSSWWHHHHGDDHGQGYPVGPGDVHTWDDGGAWYWIRSPEQERRMVMSLYNRFCIRCHGVDGRGVWDIPDVPDFTNLRWQASRPDAYRARIILEGRGAVMPSFRGTLTLEEACALARYLHTFIPGTEVSRPDLGNSPSPPSSTPSATPPTRVESPPMPLPSPPPTGSPGPFVR